MLRFIAKNFVGTQDSRRSLKQGKNQLQHPEQGVKSLFSHANNGDLATDEAPIFILSAGWRSGSTLLQRLVCSGKEVLIWGEPYDKVNVVQNLALSAAPFSKNWPPKEYIEPSEDLSQLSHRWIANLYPPASALQDAYRAYLFELFAKPAYAQGASRWGIKEVRFGYAEAVFLKTVFPNARFLFIRRHLPDAYLSYKNFNPSMNWFANWPHKTAFTPFSFAQHWAKLRRETEQAAQETNGILIEYEDLVSGQVDIKSLGEYCGVSIDESVLDTIVGSSRNQPAKKRKKISLLEKLLLELGRRA